MLSAIFSVIAMVMFLVIDLITLPFRAILALVHGTEVEFRRLSRRRP